MTLYQKRLNELVTRKMPQADGAQIVDRLFRLGVIDTTLLKVLVIREHVERLVLQGASKLDAMWQATEIFACTYEYVRKCMYYYKDLNVS